MAEAITSKTTDPSSADNDSAKPRKHIFSKSWTGESDTSEGSSEADQESNGNQLVVDESDHTVTVDQSKNLTVQIPSSDTCEWTVSSATFASAKPRKIVFSKSWTLQNRSTMMSTSVKESNGNPLLEGKYNSLPGSCSSQPTSGMFTAQTLGCKIKRKESFQLMSAFADFVENANTTLQKFTRHSARVESFTGSAELLLPNEFSGDIFEVLERCLRRLCEFNKLFCDPKLNQQISMTKKKMGSNKITIGIFGRLKSGKSTFLNSLTFSKLFPTDAANPETSIVVGVCHESNVHLGPCSDNLYHGKGKRCPCLINESGRIIAEGSKEIVAVLEKSNKDARSHGDGQKELLIKANVPALAQCKYTGKKIIVQDTPGLGEAYNERVMEMAESSLHPCSAFIYIVDCSKLKDQLDVNTLTLIRNKDSDIFKDGRLLTVANHYDKTLQKQVKQNDSPVQIIESVREMIHKGVYRQIPTRNIVLCVAYWAWSARLPDDADEDDFEYWKKKYTKHNSIPISVSKEDTPQEFVGKASGIKVVEEWITTIAENGDSLFLRSILSDVLYCAGMCLEGCFQYGEQTRTRTEEMANEMASKASIWNDTIGIVTYIEQELESLPDQLHAAYDLDIQAPCRYAKDIAQRQLECFRRECHQKCQAMNSETMSDEWAGVGEEPALVQSSVTCELSRMSVDDFVIPTEEEEDSSDYHLSEFKKDLQSFIQDLEEQLNAYLATALRFTHVQQAIPLQDFKDHKATMDLCAFIFLTGKPSADIGAKISKFDGPTLSEIEAILMQEPLTLKQLRSKAKISELKLSWSTRLLQWFKRKFTGHSSNHVVTTKDVTSAIRCLLRSRCLEECSNYITSGIKDKIVKCYFDEYSAFVKSTLDEFECTALAEMECKSKEMETEMISLLKRYHSNRNVHNYLVKCTSNLEWEKQKCALNMEKFKGEEKRLQHLEQ